MGILNHLFRSTEDITKRAEWDNKTIQKSWASYIGTIEQKDALIRRLSNMFGEKRKAYTQLKALLDTELATLQIEKKEENDLISNLKSLEHSTRIKRVVKLETCLGYAETKFEYTLELLQHLYVVLLMEASLLEKIPKTSDLRKFRKLVAQIQLEYDVEVEVIAQIGKIRTFNQLFAALVKGEHSIHTMDVTEKKLLKKMQQGMSSIFRMEIDEGVTYEWAMEVFNSIEDKFREMEADGVIDNHPPADFELVNRPEFVQLVRDTIQRIKKKKVSEQMITVFVHLFREWYNHERSS